MYKLIEDDCALPVGLHSFAKLWRCRTKHSSYAATPYCFMFFYIL